MKLFEELKRRNVFRVAGVYAVVAWLLIQIVVAVLPTLGAPPWIAKVFIVVVLAGFPIAMILAWAFEMTPEGVKLTANVAEGTSIAPKTGRKLDYAILGGIALIAAMFIYERLTPSSFALRDADLRSAPQGEGSGMAATGTPHPEELSAPAESVSKDPKDAPNAASIAVLPFADLSPAKDQEYFSDGMAEEILNVLAKVDGLTVASRTSSFQFKGREIGIPQIAEQLGVRHVLEGSVRKAGDTIRITAQLIDSTSDKHLWSETFDRPLTTENVFTIQDEIAQAIVAALSSRMAGVSKISAPPARAADTADLGAYELYLRGHQLFVARGRDNLIAAADLLAQAIAVDPAFARAHESLSAVYAISLNWGIADRDYRTLALGEAEEALRLNPALAQPYATRGFVGKSLMVADPSWTWEKTLADLDEAVRRDPKSPTIRFWRGLHYNDLGYFDRAAADMAECFRLDPAYQNCRRFTAVALLHQGRDDEALTLFEAGLAEGFSNANLPFAAAYARRGERAAALAIVTLSFIDTPGLIGPVHGAMTGEKVADDARAEALEILAAPNQQSFGDAQGARFFLKDYDGILDDPNPLGAQDPQWYGHNAEWTNSPMRKAYIRRLKLPDYWREHGFPPQCKPVGPQSADSGDFECQ